VIAERDVKDRLSCTIECVAEPRCRSVNLKKGAKCELNNATRYSAKEENYEQNIDYDHVFDSDDVSVAMRRLSSVVCRLSLT
jgi:hypothetical protein